jgi:GcrA cell cycle regulator
LLEACKDKHRIVEIALAVSHVREGVTRNSVIGKIARMRRRGHAINMEWERPERSSNGDRPPRKVQVPPPLKPRRGLPPPRDPMQHTEPPTPEIFTMRRLTLLELQKRTCRWPVGDPGTPEFFFCGNETDGERPYCPIHHAVAHGR